MSRQEQKRTLRLDPILSFLGLTAAATVISVGLGYHWQDVASAALLAAVCQYGCGATLLRLGCIAPSFRMFGLAVLPVGYAACSIIWMLASKWEVLRPVVAACVLLGAGQLWRDRNILTRAGSPRGSTRRLAVVMLVLATVVTAVYAPERRFLDPSRWGHTRIVCYWDHLAHMGQLFELTRSPTVAASTAVTRMAGVNVAVSQSMDYKAVYYLYAPSIRLLGADVPSVYLGFGLWWARLMFMLALGSVGYGIQGKVKDATVTAAMGMWLYMPDALRCLPNSVLFAGWDETVTYLSRSPSAGLGVTVALMSAALTFHAIRTHRKKRWQAMLVSSLLAVALVKIRIQYFIFFVPAWTLTVGLAALLRSGRRHLLIPVFFVLTAGGTLTLLQYTTTRQPTPIEAISPGRMIGVEYGVFADYLLDKNAVLCAEGALPALTKRALLLLPFVLRSAATVLLWMAGQVFGIGGLGAMLLFMVSNRFRSWCWEKREFWSFPLTMGGMLLFWNLFMTHPGHGRFSAWQVNASPNYLLRAFAFVGGAQVASWLLGLVRVGSDADRVRLRWGCELEVSGSASLIRVSVRFLIAAMAVHALLLGASAAQRGARPTAVPSEVIDGLLFIRDHTPAEAVVLVDKYNHSWELVNGIAGRRSVVSRFDTLKEYYGEEAGRRMKAVHEFWRSGEATGRRLQMLREYGVTHILDVENRLRETAEDLPLKSLTHFGRVWVYEVARVETGSRASGHTPP